MTSPRAVHQAAWRHISSQARRTASRNTQHLAAVQCRYASTNKGSPESDRSVQRRQEDGGGKDFQRQMWDSAYQRLQREREEQTRQGDRQGFGEGPYSRAGYLIFAAVLFFGVGWKFGQLGSSSTTSTRSTTKRTEIPEITYDLRETRSLQPAWAEFVEILGLENVITTRSELASHAGSSWSSYRSESGGELPFLIVKPLTTEDVSRIMKICHERKIPVTPYSGGTSLEGHFAPTKGGICIDFTRMDKILKLHEEDLDVIVQPGLGWELLNEKLAESGLMFPPDPGPGAQIGGMVGTGCSGTNAYKYGTMKDWVISLTVVLADGTVIKTRQRPRKSSAGYDLTRLFVGSEGTLGLVTEATLKVTPKPEKVTVAVCTFNSIREAADAVSRVVKASVPVAAVEILDDVQMRCINDAGMTQRTWLEKPTLFFKFASTPTAVKEHISLTKSIARACGSKTFEFAKTEAEADELWSARKEALWSVIAQGTSDSQRVWTTDVAVPISRLPDIIEETKADISKSGLVGSIVGHVGDGNFHAIILWDEKRDSERQAVEAVVKRMVDRAIEMEGTATGEHGVGLVKRKYLEKELGVETVDLMRRLKLAMDPLCLLNCDKVVSMEKERNGWKALGL